MLGLGEEGAEVLQEPIPLMLWGLDCSQAAAPAVPLPGRPPGQLLALRAFFSPALWSHRLSLGSVDSHAPGTGGASGRWGMTTTRLSPTGPSFCWLPLPQEQRPTAPVLTSRTWGVRTSLRGGQEQLMDPRNFLGSARLLRRAAKTTALHRSMGSFRCRGHVRRAPEARPARRDSLCMSGSVPQVGLSRGAGRERAGSHRPLVQHPGEEGWVFTLDLHNKPARQAPSEH